MRTLIYLNGTRNVPYLAVRQARNEYHVRQPDMSTIVEQLFENYQQEHIDMAHTQQDFKRDYVLDHLNLLSPDDRLKGLSPDDIINHLSPENLKKLLTKLTKQK